MRRFLLAGMGLGAIGAAAALYAATQPPLDPDEIALVQSLSLDALPPLPADPSNRVADDPRAVALGRDLFFDTSLSLNGEVSCGTCHLPERQFQDDRALAQGVGRTDRRTMPIAGMAHSPFLFWDGRKDSLWAQALGPLESPVEHGADRTFYTHKIAEKYAGAYVEIFGALPDIDHLPGRAGPVPDQEAAAAWEGMAEADRAAVNTVFANMGKAIAAYERTIAPEPTRFDRWVSSEEFPRPGALTPAEIDGLRIFIGKGECINCHNGPLLTDNHFHNTGVPAAEGLPADRGREIGAQLVLADEFNCLGPYSDADPEQCTELRFMATPGHDAVRAFKTPSLRGAVSRPPYMHAGQVATIEDVIGHYASPPDAPDGHSELRPVDLSEDERAALIAFLGAFDATSSRAGVSQ